MYVRLADDDDDDARSFFFLQRSLFAAPAFPTSNPPSPNPCKTPNLPPRAGRDTTCCPPPCAGGWLRSAAGGALLPVVRLLEKERNHVIVCLLMTAAFMAVPLYGVYNADDGPLAER